MAPTHTLRSRTANVPDDSEFIDLDNISDSDDDPPAQPPHRNHTEHETVAQIINNPDPKPPKVSTAADVHFFFETVNKQRVCKVCTYVFEPQLVILF
jgi:hypothetical protein